jgi:hypothetical protein
VHIEDTATTNVAEGTEETEIVEVEAEIEVISIKNYGKRIIFFL